MKMLDDGIRMSPNRPTDGSLAFFRRPYANLVILAVLVSTFVLFLLAITSYLSYQHVREGAASKSRTLNSLLAENVKGEFDRIRLGLEFSASQIALLRSGKLRGTINELDVLKFFRQHSPILENMVVTDGNGTILLGTDHQSSNGVVTVADRSYFKTLRSRPQQGLVISETVSGLLSGKQVLAAAFPIVRSNGDFDGVVVAAIAIEKLIQKFEAVDVGYDGAVVLRGDASRNFDLLARSRPTGNFGETRVSDRFRQMVAANPAQGTYEAHAGNDNIHRMFSYQTLGDYPMVTLVGLSTNAYMAEWYNLSFKLLLLALVFISAIMLGSRALMRSWQSRAEAEQEVALRRHVELIQEDTIKQVMQARDLAEQASLSKSRFLASASHDLRQPLQAMSPFMHALQRTRLSDEQKRITGSLDQSVRALGELLNVLLDISKLDSGATQAKFEVITVASLAGRIEAGFSDLAAQKSLRFKTFVPGGGLLVRTDVKLLMSLLGNLIGNAIKYTEKGGILVGIRCRGSQALIQVWDTGVGIAEEHLGNIYEEYFQIGNTERDSAKGLGLGLAIAKRTAKLLGTDIHCHSKPGRGSVFQFRIPLALRGKTEALGRTAPRHAARGVSPNNFSGRSCLVIEDDVAFGTAMKLALESCGIVVTRYSTAEDALADAAIAEVDFYITDLRLPGISGIEFLDTVQMRSAKPIKAVVVSGDAKVYGDAPARAKSSWPMLFKPVELASLLSAIEAQDSVQ